MVTRLLDTYTRHDDELLASFKEDFPEYFEDEERLRVISEEELKSAAAKPRWRNWLKRWEKDIGENHACRLAR